MKKILGALLLIGAMSWVPMAVAQNASSSAKTNAASSRLNVLEKILDFGQGTKAMFTDFQENGGLNKSNRWYGIAVTNLQLTWGPDGLVKDFSITPSPATTIKDLRTAINKYCGLSDSAWSRNDVQGRMSAEAKNDKCQADYNNFLYAAGQLNFSLSKP